VSETNKESKLPTLEDLSALATKLNTHRFAHGRLEEYVWVLLYDSYGLPIGAEKVYK